MLRAGRPREALTAFQRIADDRAEARVFERRAIAHYVLDESDVALAVAERGHARDPRSMWGCWGVAVAAGAQGRAALLDELYRDCAVATPEGELTVGELMLEANRQLRAHGFPELARDAAARAVAWEEAQSDAARRRFERRFDYARALYRAERWSECAAVIARLRAEDSTFLPALIYEGTLAARRGDRAAAIAAAGALATHVTREPPGTVTPWIASIYALLGEDVRAEALIRDAARSGGAFPLYFFVRSDMDFEPLRAARTPAQLRAMTGMLE